MIIDDALLDKVLAQAEENERLRINYNFHKTLDANAQRLLNALVPGTHLPIHRHWYSDETFMLIRGRIVVVLYNDNKEEIKRTELDTSKGKYGVHIPVGVWHTVEVYEPSVIFEVKDGPYMPISENDIL